ncbi:MAG: DUF6531 domain-containing protein, partial [Acidimicrobiales bacterium]
PSAPLDLQVTAGTGATALSWRAPTSDGGSPIQSYLVQVYGTNVPAPMTITCSSGPCTSDEIAGLSNGLSYTFEVSAYNGIAYGPGAFASATVPAITSDTGPYDLITHQLAPGASVGINLANGDVVMSSTDLSIAGVGIPLAITRTYNSQASSLGNTSGAFGENNSSSVGPDVSLAIASGGAVAYHAPDGSIQVFAPAGTGQYFSPPDLSAVLTQSPGGAYTLTDEPSGTELHFDASGRLTSETDRNGNAIRFAYNPGGTLASVTDTQGRVLTVAEAGGRITSITDPSGRTLAYAYDSSGDLTSFTDPMSHVWTYGYSAPGVLGSITDPDGSVTSISYAGSGVASSITYGAGSASAGTTRFAYYLGGASQCLDSTIEACTTITDADAHSSTYYFDPAGRASMSVDANGNQRTGTYDPYSNITSLTDAMVSGNAAAFYYADGAAPKAITTAYGPSPDHHISGQSDTYAYGDSSLPYLPTATTDAQGNTTNYTYDSLGNVIAITDAASNVSSYGLQGSNASCGARSGEICYSTTPAGNETTYAYDASGNQTAVHPPSPLGATNATYDALGRPVTVTQGNGTFVGLQA